MKNKAFTLIELLVVILIIGVLAAIAYPQYKLLVAKTRALQLIEIATNIAKEEEMYYFVTGSYTDKLKDLSISYVLAPEIKILIDVSGLNHGEAVRVSDTRLPGMDIMFGLRNTRWDWWRGKHLCRALQTDTFANKLCMKLTGNKKMASNAMNNMMLHEFKK